VIDIYISKDQLEARISIDADKADYPSESDIIEQLSQNDVVYGLDLELIKKIAQDKTPLHKQLIAKAKLPHKGSDAAIDWKIATHFSPEPLLSSGQRVDFKKAASFESVAEQQVLAVKSPPGEGVDGISVTNQPIPSFGDDVKLPAGRNTRISENGLELAAEISGTAFFENGLVHVDRIYHIKGNVSYATGNVKFDGPVVIEGDVRSGFRVDARDSVYIGGNVEAANIYSQHGDITVAQGIVGQNRAKMLAGGTLRCGFIQDAVVGVRKNIIVNRYIMNSSITAGGRIELTQNEGLIRGGTAASEEGIIALNAGSDRNYYTELKLQSQGENKSQHKLWDISKARSDMSLRLSSLNKRLSFLKILEDRSNELSPEKESEVNFLKKEVERLSTKVKELDEQELVLLKESSKERIHREIIIKNTIYPNVSIDFDGLGFHTDQSMSAVKIFRFKDEIIVESLLEMDSAEYDIFVPNKL